jgi:transcriptional regulator with XRE-family HTH domain
VWFRIRGAQGVKLALSGARREKGWTQADLAERLRADRTTILNLEAGRNPGVTRFLEAFSLMGYDLIAVPKNAQVTVRERDRTNDPLA